MPVIDMDVGERHALYNGDALEVLPELKGESVDFTVTSPPFSELYQYSNDPRDLSNCVSYEEFLEHYRFVVRETFRLTRPGRLAAIHCMDLKRDNLHSRDMPGDMVRLHEGEGWKFFCRVTIWKDPWLVARRTRLRSLMHKTLVADSTECRIAGGDYVMVFRKPGRNAEKVGHPHGLKRYAGSRPVPEDLVEEFRDFKGDQRKNRLSHWIWRAYASPVWMDVRQGRLLPYKQARGSEEEKHVCPLSLDVVERCLTLWSNPGDVVLTPFLGVGSEAAGALANGRRALGCELKESYFRQAAANVRAVLESGGEMLAMFGQGEPVGPDDDEMPDESAAEDEDEDGNETTAEAS